MVPVGISAAMRGVRIMVGVVRMAGMDGLPPVWGHRMAYGGSHDDGSWLLLVGHCCCGLAEVAEGLSG